MSRQQLPWQKGLAKGQPRTFPSITEQGHHPGVCRGAHKTQPWGPKWLDRDCDALSFTSLEKPHPQPNLSKPFHPAPSPSPGAMPPASRATCKAAGAPRAGGEDRGGVRETPILPPAAAPNTLRVPGPLPLSHPRGCRDRDMQDGEDAQPHGGGCSAPCHGISLAPLRGCSKGRPQGRCRTNLHVPWASGGVTSPLPTASGVVLNPFFVPVPASEAGRAPPSDTNPV